MLALYKNYKIDFDMFGYDVAEFLDYAQESSYEEENMEEEKAGFEPTGSQDNSFDALSSSGRDYDVVSREDQDYTYGGADALSGQDFTLTTVGGGGQDFSLPGEEQSVATSSFLLEEEPKVESEEALLTSDYFGWEEYPSEDSSPSVQVDEVVQVKIPQAVLDIGGEAVLVQEGDEPVPEPEDAHLEEEHVVGGLHQGHDGDGGDNFEDPAILVQSPVTPAQDLGQIQEVAASY